MERMKNTAVIIGLMVVWLSPIAGAADPTTKPSAAAPAQSDTRSSYGRDRGGRGGRGNRGDSGGSVKASAVSPSDPFAILRTRSIFVKGNQNIAPESRSTAIDGGFRNGPMVGKPESSLVFNGVTTVDGEPQALVEDLISHQVNAVRTGDGIAGGKVSAITFDDLTYEVKGQSKHVALGQNLDGNTPSGDYSYGAQAAPAPLAPSTMPSIPGMPTGPVPAFGAPVAPATPSNVSQDDVLARMKAKRNAELGIK